ncbi:MAG: hypothetical protein OCD76_17920 [Reichenbachiella sp.]
MSVKELQEYTRISKYARYNHESKRRETWAEQVDRVMEMHREKYDAVFPMIESDWEFTKGLMLEKRILGSQRALQFGGSAILKKHERLYNCSATYVDRVRAFQETIYLALCGVGVGFSVQKHHIQQLPELRKVKQGKKATYIIEDSIEGWADATGALVNSFFDTDSKYAGQDVHFDYTAIRPAGAYIKSSGTKAPGPDGLRVSLVKVKELLTEAVENGQDRLRPIQAYDILMYLSDAVVSGGIRRAATICLFSHDDDEMLKAKTGNWFVENPQRGRSNNSVLLLRNEIGFDTFKNIMNSVKEFGEPGFVWADDKEMLFNPCAEIGLYAKHWETGESGIEFCNLCEINIKACDTKQLFLDACKASAILGTFQAGYTDFPYLGKVSEEIIRREALIGVSMTGMMDRPEIAFDEELQREGARIINETNQRIAAVIGINPAARTTCVKPSGSASCILGTSSGIHPGHAKRYFRRVQANKLEATLDFFKSYNPHAVEKSVWDSSGNTDVITFLCEVSDGSKTKVDVSGIQLLEHVKQTKLNWIDHGKNVDLCVKPWLSHNVSNTINVLPDEWDEITEYIYENRHCFAGISLLPTSGDKDYPQAPFTTVHTPAEIVELHGDGSLMASGLIVHALNAFDNNLWAACDSVLGMGDKLEIPEDIINTQSDEDIKSFLQSIIDKKNWVRRAKKFATNYFDGDLRNMTYCLKDVHNWKTWCDLSRKYSDVPWDLFKEDQDNTNHEQESACAGGKCEVTFL